MGVGTLRCSGDAAGIETVEFVEIVSPANPDCGVVLQRRVFLGHELSSDEVRRPSRAAAHDRRAPRCGRSVGVDCHRSQKRG